MGNLEVQQWFDGGKDYAAGVVLFEKYGKNKLLLRNFKRIKTISLEKKLEYELGKLVATPEVKAAKQPTEKKVVSVVAIVEEQVQELEKKQSVFFHQLPPELQPELMKANTLYKECCLLKVQLNSLPDEAENAALLLQLDIDKKLKENALCWQKIDYYLEHQEMPKQAKSDFDALSPAELVKRQQYHFQNISKIKKRLEENRTLLGKAEKVKEKARLERLVAKQEADLLKKNEELQTLTRLVNGEAK